MTVQLTVAAPEGRLALEVPSPINSIELRISSVMNPGQQAFSLLVTLDGAIGGKAAVVIGRVSPFPPDQPATFAIPLSDEANRLLVATNGHAEIVVEIEPVVAGRPLVPPLEVVVSASAAAR
jgi:hypothetical protein